ncbi:MAG: PCP reductase family protein [Candidatus Dormibacteraeota bacterium]|nr:PCP reductase family protein [Candidatus Dormibacteraeota bacterium]
MAEPDGTRCPFPGAQGDGAQAEDGGCPVPHGQSSTPQWDLEAHVEAMRRAQAGAERSHLEPTRAEEMARRAAEQRAAQKGVGEIRSEFIASLGKKLGYGHPLSDRGALTEQFTWTEEAESRLAEVPEFCRELTRWRVEWTAHKKNLGTTITPEIMEIKYQMWGEVSHRIQERHQDGLEWTPSALRRFERVPDFVKGQVLEAVEGNARSFGATVVDDEVVERVIERWSTTGDFHEGLYGFR